MTSRIRRSTYDIGLAFERHSLRFLNSQLHMSLRRVGRAGDEGVDLRGWWYVPKRARRQTELYLWGGKGLDAEKLDKWEEERRKEKERKTALALGPANEDKGIDGWSVGEVEERLRLAQEQKGRDWGEVEGGEEDGEGREGYRRLRVVAQCKAEKKPLSGRSLRELEGVLAHLHGKEVLRGPHQYDSRTGAPLPRKPPATLGILLSQSGFSQNAMTRAWRAPAPLMLVHLTGGRLEGHDSGTGDEIRVRGAWWNPTLSEGVLGGKMELRREILASSGMNKVTGDAEVNARYGVWFDGKRLARVGPPLIEEEDGAGLEAKEEEEWERVLGGGWKGVEKEFGGLFRENKSAAREREREEDAKDYSGWGLKERMGWLRERRRKFEEDWERQERENLEEAERLEKLRAEKRRRAGKVDEVDEVDEDSDEQGKEGWWVEAANAKRKGAKTKWQERKDKAERVRAERASKGLVRS